MTQHVLIGVGGSGQHVVHAYLRLLALSFPSTENVPRVFIIDADASEGEGQGKRSTLITDITKLYSFLVRGDKTPSEVTVLKPYRAPETGEANASMLGELLGINGNEALHGLSHAFLADDLGPNSDRTILLTQGMMANPKVGSVALNHKIHTSIGLGDDAEEIRQWGDLFRLLRDRTGLRVAAVGSNFGGTGSGVIPALMRQIDKLDRVEAARAFMTLPWFSIEGGDARTGVSAARDQATLDPKARNAALGLHTYAGELSGSGGRLGDKLKHTDYVLCQSMRHWPLERREDNGNYDQVENRHVINLVQAAAIQSFLGLPLQYSAKGGVFSIKAVGAGEQRGRFDAKASACLRFWVGSNDSRQLSDLAADAEATSFVLAQAGDVLAATDKGRLTLKGMDVLNSMPGLERFMNALTLALKVPLEDVGRFRIRLAVPDTVYKELGTALAAQATEIRSSLLWLDGHATARGGASADTVAGVTELSTTHLFDAPVFGDSKQTPIPIPDADKDRLSRVWNSLGMQVRNADGESMLKSPVSAQAFTLFEEIFREASSKTTDGDMVGVLIAGFNQERLLATTEAATTVAARVIARAVHSRVVTARAAARSTANSRDDAQLRRSNDGTPMFDLGLNGAVVDDCRLLKLNLDEEVMGNVEELSPKHPMTLAYFDPYSGLNTRTGNVISLADYAFPEHGLRGIPNIAAPLLLQQWRIEKCRPEAEHDRFGEAYQDIENTRRATRAGIYLHARRINEAAWWLLVSADTRVRVAHNLFNPDNERLPFAKLIRDELRLRDGEALAAIVFAADSKEHAGKPIFLWSGDTWYLAANVAARLFFSNLITELPTVRRFYSATNPLRRLSAADPSRAKPLDGFFAHQIHHAVRTIEGALAASANRKTEPLGRLGQLLTDTLSELPEPSPDITSEHYSEPVGLWLRLNDGPRRSISVHSHKMVAKLKDFFCEPVFVFLDHQQVPNGLLPVDGNVWTMLQGSTESNTLDVGPKEDEKRDAATLELRNVEAMHLNIKGLGAFTQVLPFGTKPLQVIQQELAWSFAIWPNFIAPGWNYYMVSGASRLGDPGVTKRARPREVDVEGLREGMPVELVVLGRAPDGSLGPDNKLRVIGSVVEGLPRRIRGIPEVLELRVGGRVLGSRPLSLPRLNAGRSVDMLGVDFGTSNTCVAVQAQLDDPESRWTVPLLPGGALNEIKVGSLLGYLDSSGSPVAKTEFLTMAAAFYHVKNDTVEDEKADTLPSELLVSLSYKDDVADHQKTVVKAVYKDEEPLVEVGDGLAKLAEDYPFAPPLMTPLPPQPYGMVVEDRLDHLFRWLLEMCNGADVRLFGDLKWPRGDSEPEIRKSRARRALYLEQMLVAALAVLRSKGYSSFTRFVATQPEALSRIRNHFAATYADDLQTVVSELSKRTGMRWGSEGDTSPKVLLVSETVAAIRTMGAAGKNVSVVTIDVGGGTTDVGINLNHGAQGGQPLRYTASARFAGNNLLKALGSLKEVRESLASRASGGTILSPEAAKALLKADLRGRNRAGVSSSQTADLVGMFFDAVFEYAFRALSLFLQIHPNWLERFEADKQQKFRVALFGNGFKLYEAFQQPGNGATLKRYCEDVKKRVVEAGLLTEVLANRLEFIPPKATKTVLISHGGMDAAHHGDLFKQDNDDVLLPPGLLSRGEEGEEGTEKAVVIGTKEFRKKWMGANKDSVAATRSITLDSSNGGIQRQFPLTYRHWQELKRESELDDVFSSEPWMAQWYIDTGALYLSDRPTKDGRSFSWLMSEYAKVEP